MINNHTYKLIFVFLAIAFTGCKSKSNLYETQQYAELEKIVDSRSFEVENNWAIPLRGTQINLIGNDNFISFSKDSLRLFLPYFGVRQMGGGYDPVVGFEYEGRIQELQINKKPAENLIEVLFETDQKTETLNYRLTLYGGGNSRLKVNSNQRDNISYTGNYRESEKAKY